MANNRKTRSMRGETVDFDLLKIKQKIQSREKPDEVERREQYIDIRRRRNPRRNVADLIADQERNENDAAEKIRISREAKKKNPRPVVQDAAPAVETVSPEPSPIEELPSVAAPQNEEAPKATKKIVKPKK